MIFAFVTRLRRLVPIIAREFVRFISANMGTFFFVVIIALLLFGNIGKGMGIPQLMRNASGTSAMPAIISGDNFFTTSFWTSFFVYYLSFIVFIVVRLWEANRLAKEKPVAPDALAEEERASVSATHLRERRLRAHALRYRVWKYRKNPVQFLALTLEYFWKIRRPFWLYAFLMAAWIIGHGKEYLAWRDVSLGFLFGFFFTGLIFIAATAIVNLFLSAEYFADESRTKSITALRADSVGQLSVAFLAYFLLSLSDTLSFPVTVYLFLFIVLLFMFVNLVFLTFSWSRLVILGVVAPLFHAAHL